MRQLNGVYTQLYNRRHGTEGPVFHGRFKSVVFEKESFLLPIVRRAALNPVRVRAAKAPANYRHSSYPALIREAPVPEMLSANDIYEAIGFGTLSHRSSNMLSKKSRVLRPPSPSNIARRG